MSSQASLSQFARFVRHHAAVLGLIVVVTGAVAVSLYSKPSDESKPPQAKNSTKVRPQLDKFVTHATRKTRVLRVAWVTNLSSCGLTLVLFFACGGLLSSLGLLYRDTATAPVTTTISPSTAA